MAQDAQQDKAVNELTADELKQVAGGWLGWTPPTNVSPTPGRQAYLASLFGPKSSDD
jgi:hypothetical protein